MKGRETLLLILLSILHSNVAASSSHSGATCAAADSLSRLVEFFSRNSFELDADGYFGAAIALLVFDSAPLSSLVTERRVAELCGDSQAVELRRAVGQLRQVLNDFRNRVVGASRGRSGGGGYDARTYWGICRPMETVMRRLLGEGQLRWRLLDASGAARNGSKEAQAWLESMKSNLTHYDEAVGDACFLRLLARRTISHYSTCHPTKVCRRMFLSTGRVVGYGLTHQVAYWMASMARSCHLKLSNQRPVSRALISRTCRQALREHRNILASDSADSTLIDLAIEQAFLCGSLGYRDFFPDSTLLLLRRLQDEKLGCFRDDVSLSRAPESASVNTGRRLTHNTLLEGVCSSHTSGLAAAYFALYLRS